VIGDVENKCISYYNYFRLFAIFVVQATFSKVLLMDHTKNMWSIERCDFWWPRMPYESHL